MHYAIVIDQRHIALLPLQIDNEFFCQCNRRLHSVDVQCPTVAQRNGFAAIVARVLPAEKSRDELVEKRAAAVCQFTHRRQYRCSDAKRIVSLPLPRISKLRQFGFCSSLALSA